jgi:hypothetical protein
VNTETRSPRTPAAAVQKGLRDPRRRRRCAVAPVLRLRAGVRATGAARLTVGAVVVALASRCVVLVVPASARVRRRRAGGLALDRRVLDGLVRGHRAPAGSTRSSGRLRRLVRLARLLVRGGLARRRSRAVAACRGAALALALGRRAARPAWRRCGVVLLSLPARRGAAGVASVAVSRARLGVTMHRAYRPLPTALLGVWRAGE